MDLGEPKRTIIIKPATIPVPARPTRIEQPQPVPAEPETVKTEK